ncbi:unnamed protein product [Caenorhabditis brenneri]
MADIGSLISPRTGFNGELQAPKDERAASWCPRLFRHGGIPLPGLYTNTRILTKTTPESPVYEKPRGHKRRSDEYENGEYKKQKQ